MKKLKNRTSGITLIALVVTIIVLLILAGISIQMLTGENGVLKRAGDAKELSGIGQEKDILALAYNSALSKKITEDNTTLVTDQDMNTELTGYEATAKGNDPIKVTFTESKRQYSIFSNGEIRYLGVKDDNNNDNIEISVTTIETESRAVYLSVNAKILEGDSEFAEYNLKELEENNPEQFQNYFVEEYKSFSAKNGAPESYINQISWSYLVRTYVGSSVQEEPTVHDIFNRIFPNSTYSNVYDFIACNHLTFTCNGIEFENGFVAVEPGCFITASSENGDYGEYNWTAYPEGKVEMYSGTAVEKENNKHSATITSIDNKNVEVPEGFYYGISDNVGKVGEGFVITDHVKKVGDNYYSDGNEFVWIPIDKNTLNVEGTNKKMAELVDGNYKGILYDLERDINGNTILDRCVEPSIVSGCDDTNPYQSEGITDALLQTDYNNMISSIKKYGGFYVARYEMGVENSNPISKINVKPTTSGYNNDPYNHENNSNNETKLWYGLYKMAKKYANDKQSVVSNMIWGSQYDAMIIFATTNSNNISPSMGGSYVSGIGYTGVTLPAPGDKLINVFELAGNLFEWTMTKNGNDARAIRGGYRGSPHPITFSGGMRPGGQIESSYITYGDGGTRMTLYIKE